METLDKLLVYTHILAGMMSLLSGYAIFFFKKGQKIHKGLGKFYVGAMIASCVTSALIMSLFRFNLFLMVISVFSFYLSIVGYRIVQGRKRDKANAGDWIVTMIITLSAVAFLGFGILYLAFGKSIVLGGLLCFFGMVAFFLSLNDWKFLRNRDKLKKDPNWWIRYHIQGMIASMIAATTAFLVNVGNGLVGNTGFGWVLWVLPTTVGTLIIMHWTRKFPQKEKRKTAK